MKRIWIWLLAAGALAMTGLWPMESCDVAELQPARVLMITMENGRIAADCGEASGSGATLDEALRDMERTAQGNLFLDTAEQVLIHTSAYAVLPQAAQSDALRPAAKVYLVEGELPEAEAASKFLQTHSGRVTLGRVRAAILGAGSVQPPHLVSREGRLQLIEQ